MSDEEHHFESKADAGASKTYPQQAGTIRKNGYIVIKSRPCKVHFHTLISSFFIQFFSVFCIFHFKFSGGFGFWLIWDEIYGAYSFVDLSRFRGCFFFFFFLFCDFLLPNFIKILDLNSGYFSHRSRYSAIILLRNENFYFIFKYRVIKKNQFMRQITSHRKTRSNSPPSEEIE